MPQTLLWNVSHKNWESYKVRDKVPEGRRGKWRVRHVTVSEDDTERLLHASQGRDPGSGDFVTLQFKRAGRWYPMMSDTRAEILEHIEAIDKMAWPFMRRVLIHGLGLGVVLNAALSFKHIEHIDVVELDQDVIDLVGPVYANDPRVTIHQGDAFTYKFLPNTSWDVVWHDIWPTIRSSNLPQMTHLKRRYGNRCQWQGAWGEPECRALLRHENMSGDQLLAEEWRRFEQRFGAERAAEIKEFLDEQMSNVPHAAVVVAAAQPKEALV